MKNSEKTEEAKLILDLTHNGTKMLKILDTLQELDKTKNSYFEQLNKLQVERNTIQQKINQLTQDYEKA